ncbi:hypothetical protein LIA77_05964 [Sarocladium implicatum]|nr:hypothetical protein LIA77_05964 [Sarocladium implicatum]
MGSSTSKQRRRGRSPRSAAREQLAFREPPHRPPIPKPPREPPPFPTLDWPIRLSKPTEDPWLPGWQGPRIPQWLLWIPVEVVRPPEYPEPRTTTRTAYIRCLENRALSWHLWRYPQKRDFDLWYAVDRAKEAEMVAKLNDIAYAQQEILGNDDWVKYEVIPAESGREQGPEVDGTVPDRIPEPERKRPYPYWIFYPAGPLPYQWLPNTDPEEVWHEILKRRAAKWIKWQFPGRHYFRARFAPYEPEGRGGAMRPEDTPEPPPDLVLESASVQVASESANDESGPQNAEEHADGVGKVKDSKEPGNKMQGGDSGKEGGFCGRDQRSLRRR